MRNIGLHHFILFFFLKAFRSEQEALKYKGSTQDDQQQEQHQGGCSDYWRPVRFKYCLECWCWFSFGFIELMTKG